MNQALWIQWLTQQTSPLFLRRFHSCRREQIINKWAEEIVSLWDHFPQPSLPSLYARHGVEQWPSCCSLEYANLSPAWRSFPMPFTLAGKVCSQTSHDFLLPLLQVSTEMSPVKEASLIILCKTDLPRSPWCSILFSLYLLSVETVLFMCYFFIFDKKVECKSHCSMGFCLFCPFLYLTCLEQCY